MAEFPSPAPIGSNPSPGSRPGDFGIPGTGLQPSPANSEIPLDAPKPTPSPPPASSPCGNVELTLIADFPNPWTSNPQQEILLLQSTDKTKHWSPSTDDFTAMAKADKLTPITVARFADFISRIENAGGSSAKKNVIKRINFITHSSGLGGIIGMGGTIDASNGSVTFNPGSIQQLSDILDPNIKANLDTSALNAFFVFDPQLGKQPTPTLSDLRDKFCANAEVFFYGCNSGKAQNLLLLQDFADTFKVKARGTDDDVQYVVPVPVKNFDRGKTETDVGSTSPPVGQGKPGFKHLDPKMQTKVGIPKPSAP